MTAVETIETPETEMPEKGYALSDLLNNRIPEEEKFEYAARFYLVAISNADSEQVTQIRDWVLNHDKIPLHDFHLLIGITSMYTRISHERLTELLLRPQELKQILRFHAEENEELLPHEADLALGLAKAMCLAKKDSKNFFPPQIPIRGILVS